MHVDIGLHLSILRKPVMTIHRQDVTHVNVLCLTSACNVFLSDEQVDQLHSLLGRYRAGRDDGQRPPVREPLSVRQDDPTDPSDLLTVEG